MFSEFRSPGSQYRGKPFWSWNGRLEPDELRSQIRLLKRMGFGGFFMHARVGLATPYLSADWFSCVDACIDEAVRTGMEAWLYDEDRWPSGAAGGIATSDRRYRQRSLVLRQTRSARNLFDKNTVAVFAATVNGANAHSVKRIRSRPDLGTLRGRPTFLHFSEEEAAPSPWYNGATYLDTLSREAVGKFIATTHDAYARNCGEFFGATVPGIFTDEPNFGHVVHRRADGSITLPWTRELPAIFRRRYGYDLIGKLAELVFVVDNRRVSEVRHDFHDCITFLFTDSFSRQIGQWCDRHGIVSTGHVLEEPTLSSQVSVVGSCMRFYEHMQAPGMDLLTQYNREYDTAKQVSSVAHQFGRRWRTTETYGCTGWDFPFTGHKALGDWQVALGINLRCQHLAWYTMAGEAKRDYPASTFYQSPWWELYGHVEDYFSRVHAVMTRGEEVRDVLVIHPVESMWQLATLGWRSDTQVQAFDRMLIALRDCLLQNHLDFDYADEDILARHGAVFARGNDANIRVNKASYRAVVVPEMLTIRGTTLKLLGEFIAAGGQVVFVGTPPSHVDAMPSGAAAGLAAIATTESTPGPRLIRTLAPRGRRISIADPKGKEIGAALYLLREDDIAQYLFVCNTGHNVATLEHSSLEPAVAARDRAFPDVRVTVNGRKSGAPLELDPSTGAVYRTDATYSDGAWTLSTSLHRLGSRLFVIPKGRSTLRYPERPEYRRTRRVALSPRRYRIVLDEPNCCVLDTARYRIGHGGGWQGAAEVLKIDGAVRDHLGIPHRGGRMCQPWAAKSATGGQCTEVELEFSFDVESVPQRELLLAIERPQLYSISVNGQDVGSEPERGWWVDRSCQTVSIDPCLVRRGVNTVGLRCHYSAAHPGLESIFLLGQFGVRVSGLRAVVTELPAQLTIGDWTSQGLPFYGGAAGYLFPLRVKPTGRQRVILSVPEYKGTVVRVLVDGVPAGTVAWEPREVDLTSFVRDGGEHEVCVQVVGHRRNSHGPLHLANKAPRWTGPGEFVPTGNAWTDEWNLVPCGLTAHPVVELRSPV